MVASGRLITTKSVVLLFSWIAFPYAYPPVMPPFDDVPFRTSTATAHGCNVKDEAMVCVSEPVGPETSCQPCMSTAMLPGLNTSMYSPTSSSTAEGSAMISVMMSVDVCTAP